MEFDVLIVGGGPGGLAAAIRLKQLAQAKGSDLQVCVIEKGSEVGAHTLSGAVMDPLAMQELFPDWKALGAPMDTEVKEDRFFFLSERDSILVPPWALPDCFVNHGNYIVSLSNVVKWMGKQAEAMGIDIYPGFPAASISYNDDGSVKGVITGDMGISRDGSQRDDFQPGMALHAKYSLFAEGSRGHLGRQLIERFRLDEGRDPQSYGIGLKELWEVNPKQHQEGLVIHTAGWPLQSDTYGGSFLYHMKANLVQHDQLDRYPQAFEASWLYQELYRARNFKAAMSKGLWTGTFLVGIDQLLFKGKAPFTLHQKHHDHEMLKEAEACAPIDYPKPDGKISFDRLSSVFIANTNHEENQPAHLTLKDPTVPTRINLTQFAGPEQ
ncbi:MAG: FAD-binding protein, partial [Betaproteobacteria bacterium]|nr:FAD-binding protein [Betaproteobacteria bacterium]